MAIKLFEEQGYHYGEPDMEDIANRMEEGNTYGYLYNGGEFGEVEIDGTPISDKIKSDKILDYVLRDLSYPVKDGHTFYNGFDFIYQADGEEDEQAKADLIALGMDKDKVANLQDGDEIECWFDFDIKYVNGEDEEEDEVEESYPFKKNPVCKDKHVGGDDPTDDGSDGEAVSESLGKVLVQVFSPKVGGWHSMLVKSVEEAKRWVKDLELDLSEDYFEIHTGDNATDVDGLVAWGGKGGYWANVVSGQFDDAPFNKNKSEREKARDEKIRQAALKKEVKNGTLKEGWKDNLKKAAGAAAVAGTLFASNPANGQDVNYDSQEEYVATDADVAKKLPDGSVVDIYGRQWTAQEWEDLKNGLDPFDDHDDITKTMSESYQLNEGTANFMMFEDSPNLAFDDEEIESENLYNELKSVVHLPSYAQEHNRNFPAFLVDSLCNTDFACLVGRQGYYEGFNIGVVKNTNFEEWAYDNYDEVDGMYYEYGSEKAITPEKLKAEFEQKVEAEAQKGIEELKKIHEMWGGMFIEVAYRASNGETGYKQVNESEEPENKEETSEHNNTTSEELPTTESPVLDKAEADFEDIKIRDTAWEELDLSGVMKAIEAEDEKATLAGNTAEESNVSLRTSTAKSVEAEMIPSENKEPEKSKEPEVDTEDQKDRIDGAEKTKAEIHEGFENIINETERFWVGSTGDGHTYYTSDDYEDACQWAKKNVNKIHSTLVIGSGYTKWKEYTPRTFGDSELEKVNYESLYRLFNILYKSKGENFINKNTDLKDVIKAVSKVGLKANIYYRLELNDERMDKKYAIALMKHWNELCAEKTKAEIHEGFEFKFNEEALNEAEGSDIISFEITNGDGLPCEVKVNNKSSGQFTADELKKVIEKENPSIWFNDAEAKYWFMDFSFEKGGKTYWMSSDDIAGDMSKYKLSIYDGNNYGNNDKPLKESLESNVDMKTFVKKFGDEYKFLYDNHDKVAGYDEAVDAFNVWVKKPENKKFMKKFFEVRGDFISSDREAAAFMFAMESFGLLEEVKKEPAYKIEGNNYGNNDKKLNEAKEPMSLSDFKKKMKEKGYNVRSKSVSFQGLGYGNGLDVKVYDGSTLINGGDGMSPEHFSKYKDVFDILNNYKIVNEAKKDSAYKLVKKTPDFDIYQDFEGYFMKVGKDGKVIDQGFLSVEDAMNDGRKATQLTEAVVDGLFGLISAVREAFRDGRYGKYGKWECGLGGYDTGYQCSYNHIPYFEIKEDDTIKFLNPSLMKRKVGITPEEVIDYLNEYDDFNFSMSDENDDEIDESVDTDIEIGSVVALSDRYQNRCGDVIGFDGKMYQIDIDGDGSTYDVLPKDIIEVIQEPILDESARLSELASKMVLREADEEISHYFYDDMNTISPKDIDMNFIKNNIDNYLSIAEQDNHSLVKKIESRCKVWQDYIQMIGYYFYKFTNINDVENSNEILTYLKEYNTYTDYLEKETYINSNKKSKFNEKYNEYLKLSKINDSLKNKLNKINNHIKELNVCMKKLYDNNLKDIIKPGSFDYTRIHRYIPESFNMVLREADESSVAKVKINSVIFNGKEGRQDDKNWVEGKEYSFEEFQKLVYEYDYAFWNQADRGGYDKLWYIANITLDYNGNKEDTTYEGRLDLGDGKYGTQHVSVIYQIKNGIAYDLGIDEGQVKVLNKDVPYDSEAYASKYGNFEDNLDKFIADKSAQIKTPKYSKDKDNMKPEDVEVGDFFIDSDTGRFYRVTRRTKASVWVEKVKSKTVSTPYKNRGELDYQTNAYPTDEVDTDTSGYNRIDTNKPLRLNDYGSYVLASQGRHYLSFWGGKELSESFKGNTKALVEDEAVVQENPLKEGDILCSSWGYSMKLVDFYKVLSSSKSFVKLAHLADYNSKQDEYGQAGYKMPKVDQVEPDSNVDGRRFKVHFTDENKPYVSINNYERAYVWNGKPQSFDTYD